LRISMERADLKTLDAMKARVCTALFDHGLDIGELEKLRGDNMFYILGVRHTQIYNPNDVPTGATVCFTNVIVDNDPCIYKILVDSYILPVEVPCRPMKCIEDIEHHVRLRMKQYGATFNNKNHLIVKHARWTLCTPTRRNYKHDVVQILDAQIDIQPIKRAINTIGNWYHETRRRRASNIIKHAYLRHVHSQMDMDGWVDVTDPCTA